MASRRTQAIALTLVLFGALLCVVVVYGFIRDAIMIRYYVFRLNDAQTFQEAKQLLHEALNHKALTPNSILEHLGPPNKQFTFWFFCYLDSGNVNSRSIMDCFSNELETNCDIMYYWSYFVRWRLGTKSTRFWMG